MDSPSNLVGVGKYRSLSLLSKFRRWLLDTGELSRACDFKLLRVGELADFELADLDWFGERCGELKASLQSSPTASNWR